MGLIYRYSHPFNDHGYTGKTETTVEKRDKERFYKSSVNDSKGLKNAMVKYGKEHFRVDIIQDGIMHREILNLRERYWIRYFDDYHNGYNRTQGGDGVDSETARERQLKRVEDGTHHWLGGEQQREATQRRLADGTHNMLGGEMQRRMTAEGKNPFTGGEIQSRTQRRLVEEGKHPFQSGKRQREVQSQRVADGTHHFFDSEFQRNRIEAVNKSNRKRIKDGTHNFLDPQIGRKSGYVRRIKAKNCRREFYRWVSVILTAKSVCEERIYRKRMRDGFFDKDIPDTSESEQLNIF